jgi:mono/diheme cytochrome c family protein
MNYMRWKRLLALTAITLFPIGCDYARMNNDAGVRLYEQQLPDMPSPLIPTGGGEEAIKAAGPDEIKNPLPFSGPVIQQGKVLYGYFCAQCHGPEGDGNGIVGQHFDPRPTDLRFSSVQQQSDGQLFFIISYGKRRQPPLAYTIALEDRWRIIYYVRTLERSRGGAN